jgi:hypothetical protein
MDRRNLAAFTPVGTAPPYISINEVAGAIEITVRSHAPSEGICGQCSMIRMQKEQLRSLLSEALAALDG